MEILKRPKIKLCEDREIKEDSLGVLHDFVRVLRRDFCDLNIFFHKLPQISFEATDRSKLSRDYIMAEYDILGRKIYYDKKYFKDAIMHELLHLASTVIYNNRIYSGISQIDLDTNEVFGVGANEALTCILDDKYFGDYTETKGESLRYSYHILKSIMEYIPMLFGEDEVFDHYFKADLPGFLEMLSLYIEPDKALTFMMALDNIHGCARVEMSKGYLGPIATKILFDNYRYAMDVIGELYLTAVYSQYHQENIDEEQLYCSIDYINRIMNVQLRCVYLPFIRSKVYKQHELYQLNKNIEDKVIKKLSKQ